MRIDIIHFVTYVQLPNIYNHTLGVSGLEDARLSARFPNVPTADMRF